MANDDRNSTNEPTPQEEEPVRGIADDEEEEFEDEDDSEDVEEDDEAEGTV